jgi:hypothetical protein
MPLHAPPKISSRVNSIDLCFLYIMQRFAFANTPDEPGEEMMSKNPVVVTGHIDGLTGVDNIAPIKEQAPLNIYFTTNNYNLFGKDYYLHRPYPRPPTSFKEALDCF